MESKRKKKSNQRVPSDVSISNREARVLVQMQYSNSLAIGKMGSMN
jgi:hypothetical protein